jgi:hypothetical protein
MSRPRKYPVELACELERLLVVVREQLCVILWPPEPFDPLAGAPMLLRPCASRNLPVRDVAEQHVLEGVLGVAGDGRSPLAPNEILPLQRAQYMLCIDSGQTARCRDAAKPEDLPLHRSLLQQLLLGPRQRVQPGCDHALHRFRQFAGRSRARSACERTVPRTADCRRLVPAAFVARPRAEVAAPARAHPRAVARRHGGPRRSAKARSFAGRTPV